MIGKTPGFVSFRANLAHFGTKYDIAVRQWPDFNTETVKQTANIGRTDRSLMGRYSATDRQCRNVWLWWICRAYLIINKAVIRIVIERMSDLIPKWVRLVLNGTNLTLWDKCVLFPGLTWCKKKGAWGVSRHPRRPVLEKAPSTIWHPGPKNVVERSTGSDWFVW